MSLFEEDEQEERNIDVIARFREFNGNYKLANREANVSGVAEGINITQSHYRSLSHTKPRPSINR